MPTIVFLFGMLSIVLLLWAERISVRLQNDEVLVDAVMDVQIRTATYHLRLEEVLSGVASTDVEEAFTALDQAIHLVDLSLNGGEAEYGRILEPLKDPELRFRVEAIRPLLLKIKVVGLERLKFKKTGIDPILEDRFEAVFKEALAKARELEDLLERDEAENQRKSSHIFLAITVGWPVVVIVATAGLLRLERKRKKAAERLLKANEQLSSQTEELTEHREHLAELVKKRTAELMAANERIRVEMAERLETCETLHKTEREIQHLSGKLLRAQEVERKRIAMGLHDELGQDLNAMKLQIRVVEKGLKADQEAIREDCEKLLDYIDQVIEEVRRLSLDLSPTVLEDLGLTAALRWLISNLEKIPDMHVTAEVAEIDRLFPENNWITIYRIIQEALTNVAKHARAENVSIVIQPQDHRVVFSIVDDGEGFDPEQLMIKGTSEKGFGLTTLNERVGIMGGTHHLWSHIGKGTRITFSIPIEKPD